MDIRTEEARFEDENDALFVENTVLPKSYSGGEVKEELRFEIVGSETAKLREWKVSHDKDKYNSNDTDRLEAVVEEVLTETHITKVINEDSSVLGTLDIMTDRIR